MSIRSSLRQVLVALPMVALMVLLSPTAAHAMKPNPETAPHAPDQDAGYFLGYPTPTYSWHGCTKFSSQKTPATLDAGVPDVPKGNKQSKVTWTVETSTTATSGYVLRWKVAAGWKICGVQAAVLGRKADADADYAMEAGYTSKAKKGNTVTSGSETVRVKLSKDDCDALGIDRKLAGTWSIVKIYSLAVFVKPVKKN